MSITPEQRLKEVTDLIQSAHFHLECGGLLSEITRLTERCRVLEEEKRNLVLLTRGDGPLAMMKSHELTRYLRHPSPASARNTVGSDARSAAAPRRKSDEVAPLMLFLQLGVHRRDSRSASRSRTHLPGLYREVFAEKSSAAEKADARRIRAIQGGQAMSAERRLDVKTGVLVTDAVKDFNADQLYRTIKRSTPDEWVLLSDVTLTPAETDDVVREAVEEALGDDAGMVWTYEQKRLEAAIRAALKAAGVTR
jgi:hypothetical protein